MEEKIRLAVFGQKRLSREGGISYYIFFIFKTKVLDFVPVFF